jgi:hypothetical protein
VGVCAGASGSNGAGEVPSRELDAGAAMAIRTAGVPAPERCSSFFYRHEREEASMLRKRREVGGSAA